MNYELVEELKDAGFPIGYGDSDNPPRDWVPNLEARDYKHTYFTGFSLSELIEACGEPFKALEKTETQTGWAWYAYDLEGYCSDILEGWKGSTPEEAVARLWLALNKK